MFPVTSLDSPLQAYLTLEALQMKILPQRTKLPYLRFPFSWNNYFSATSACRTEFPDISVS